MPERSLTSMGDDRADLEEFWKQKYGSGVHFRTQNLAQFVVKNEGLEFRFDYGLPHAVNALSPSGDFLIPYDELLPHLDPAGPLAWVFEKGAEKAEGSVIGN